MGREGGGNAREGATQAVSWLGSGVNICAAGGQMCSKESRGPCLWFLPLTWCSSNSKVLKIVCPSCPAIQRVRKRNNQSGLCSSVPSQSSEVCGRRERKYSFPIFYFTGVVWETHRKGSENKKRLAFQTHHDYIPFTQSFSFFFAFFFAACASPWWTDNFVHSCGFSETPNQTFKQMISWCNELERTKKQQNSPALREQ